MEKFLNEYVKSPSFREGLKISENSNIELVPLGQGEYNVNYSFVHPHTGQKLLIRKNTGSQLHLADQIGYEFSALKDLEISGRTPKAYYCDSENSILVMEWLPGRALDYKKELPIAAEILADIHSVPVPENTKLINPGCPLQSIYDECLEMASHYLTWENADKKVCRYIDELIAEIGKLPLKSVSQTPLCIVNTELNSANFLINPDGISYLIDWEKPLLSEPAQDLGHMLVPTTTFWKTDVILSPKEVKDTVSHYIKSVKGRIDISDLKERFPLYFTVTCLRGITWCSMAMREYSAPGRSISNADTFLKIKDYLKEDFLSNILNNYVKADFLK